MLAALRDAPAWDGAALTGQLGLEPARRLDTLSVGQRRKAELVAALAGDPDVLLLDEVFAPLDTRSVSLVAELFDRARSTKILLLTGHGALPLASDQVLSL